MADGGFCVNCGHRVESFDGLSACPKCGSTGVPCPDDSQVTVSVNWQELRVLGIWAENYQRTLKDGGPVYAIAKRLEAQHPTRAPLTLAGELGQLAKEYDISVSSPELRQDIAAQTGEETGLTGDARFGHPDVDAFGGSDF